MGIDVNMNGVDAWTPGSTLSPGSHTVKVVEAKEEPSQSGTAQIILKMEAIAGPETGGTITDWIAITQKSLGRVRMIMEAFQLPIPQGTFSLEASSFLGREARIVVGTEPGRKDPSKTFTVVSGYEPSGNGVAGGMGGAAVANDPIAQAAAQPAQNGAQPVAAGGVPYDDIPF